MRETLLVSTCVGSLVVGGVSPEKAGSLQMSLGTHWRREVEDGRRRDADGQAVRDDGVVTPVVGRLVAGDREEW